MKLTIQIALVFLFAFTAKLHAQEPKKIIINHPGDFTKDDKKYPGADIMSKDNQQVQFEHDGIDLWCDVAVFWRKDNRIQAFGNVFFKQGDTLRMTSNYAEYDANTKIALAREGVRLQNNSMSLTTEEVRFDRNAQLAYYNTPGTVRDTANTLTSNRGRYYLETDKYEFSSEVEITNPDYNIESDRLDYYTKSRTAYMYGPSTITGNDYRIYCERGYYNTVFEKGYGVKNTRIDYNDRIIFGDSLFFDKTRSFASATNNIQVIDTINNGVIKGHYAEVFKNEDSVFVTKKALAISVFEKDSLYIHGDTLMVTGPEDGRIIRAFKDARFYKSDMSGKCDSIHSDQRTGITRFYTYIPPGIPDNQLGRYRPIIWSANSQMTGDSILLVSNTKTEKLDSLKVLGNAFIIQKDSLSHVKYKEESKKGFNQIKAKDLYGHFENNELQYIDMIKNAELIYYLWDDKGEFIGIDKRLCGKINFTLNDNGIDKVTSFINVDGRIHAEGALHENERRYPGFYWRGDEMITGVNDLFSAEDNAIELTPIRGINEPIDPDNPDLTPENLLDNEEETPTDKKTEGRPKAMLKPKETAMEKHQ
ncbi:OstA-like protein [Robertkochia marina]|uniref:OstA-like protein n=1 Tax=Robertkochia marina TaxID=1227945 RepID=A0A4S3LYC2_9FLAO|nr:OstA-like protein [Robertkochia marina]THD66562.1 OstA-like protein [Robertkochia marina]TRZ45599.1 OstA-like protein [Robertkochia marina]